MRARQGLIAVAAVVILVAALVLAATNSHLGNQSLSATTAPIAGSISTIASPIVRPEPLPPTATVTTYTEPTLSPGDQATRIAIVSLLPYTCRVFTEVAATETAGTPYPTPTAGPTRIGADVYDYASAGKLGLFLRNTWGGYLDGNPVSVYAGAWAAHASRGVLIIFWIFHDHRPGIYREIEMPSQHGPVRIVTVRNNRLELASTDGTIYYFDVPALRFVSSLAETVPTITPQPTETPPSCLPPMTAPPGAYP